MRAIDFFCGGGGMTNGLIQAGIEVIAGVDLDLEAKETYEHNNHGATFVNADLNRLHTDYFEKKMGVERFDDEMIFVGCSPCQFYSIIRSSKEKSIKTKDLLLRFRRFVDYYRPGYLLIENVPGILTNKDSAWREFLPFLEKAGYNNLQIGNCKFDIVNMKDYGIAQNRKRFSLIATRLNRPVNLPEKENEELHVRDVIGDENILKALARSLYFDRYLNLFEKYIKWNLIDEDTKIIFFNGTTDSSGMIERLRLPAPILGSDNLIAPKWTVYNIKANYDGEEENFKVNLYDGICVQQIINIVPNTLVRGFKYGN